MGTDIPTGLEIARREEPGGLIVLALTGYLDLSTAHLLGEEIGKALPQAHRLDLDLTGVSFADSSGLREFVLGYQRAQALGKGYRVTGATGSVRQVLEISGMLDYLTEGVAAAGEDET
jgi:anti-sigma B factor antagonist